MSLDLLSVYLRTLDACAPEGLVRDRVPADAPHDVVAIGKAAGPLLDGVAAVHRVETALAVIPRGYKVPSTRAEVVFGGHPDITQESFEAGRRVCEFVDARDDVLFLVSGGGSACLELPLPPFNERDLAAINARLVASGLPIGAMNTVRKHLSSIKGGRLAQRVRGHSLTLVYSDVSTGALADVASGPTLPDTTTKRDAITLLESIGGCDRIVTALRDPSVPDTVHDLDNVRVVLVADNDTLTRVAANIAQSEGWKVTAWGSQVEMDVGDAADALAMRAARLASGEMLVAGGEPTVVMRGHGRGGRCSELAVRFALAASGRGLTGVGALFSSTDGVDGNSGAAGVLLQRIPDNLDPEAAREALAASDSFPVAAQVGDPIMITPTGNNLRDLYLVARR